MKSINISRWGRVEKIKRKKKEKNEKYKYE